MASLSPFTSILGVKNARHLLRRSTFSYTKALVDQLSVLTADQALTFLTQTTPYTISLPYDPSPVASPDGFWTESTALPNTFQNQQRKAIIVSGWWWYNAINSPNLQYKLSHFLSTCFTIQKNGGSGTSTEFYDHVRLLLFYAYGSYKSLAKKMTLDNAMLRYLDNTDNNKNAPNENYAREFLELFTIGKGEQIGPGNYTNYTEADIVQAAKVLTGFKRLANRTNIDPETNLPSGVALFNQHETAQKVFSGAFNNTVIVGATNAAAMHIELQQFIDMVFNQTATSKNIVRKIYRYFVKANITDEVENEIITPLAIDLKNNGYQVLPIVNTLLKSQHFYDLDDDNPNNETIGAIIKSPIQQLGEICKFLHADFPNFSTQAAEFWLGFWVNFAHNVYTVGANMPPFDPDSVAGHPAYFQAPNFDKDWISATTIIARYRIGESLLDGLNRITSNNNIFAKINISQVIKNNNIVSDAYDPNILCAELMKALFAQEPDLDRINYFKNTFLLQGFMDYNWFTAWEGYINTNNNSVVEPRLKLLVSNILKSPEAQMF